MYLNEKHRDFQMNTVLQHKIEFDPLMVTKFGSEKAAAASAVADFNNGISLNNQALSDETIIMNALNDELESDRKSVV